MKNKQSQTTGNNQKAKNTWEKHTKAKQSKTQVFKLLWLRIEKQKTHWNKQKQQKQQNNNDVQTSLARGPLPD